MYNFSCDYLEGAHQEILDALQRTNLEQTPGYSLDKYSIKAAELIKKACNNQALYVHLVVGGTQANTIIISSLLKPYQGILSADEGHINVHETGAIEALGHKVIALSTKNGKLSADQISSYITWHRNLDNREHVVEPGAVYISFPTEGGLLYTKNEIENIYQVCKKASIPLFIDGARLGYGLMSPYCDITLQDLPNLCDVFYIGGTKVGALFGEAIVTSYQPLITSLRPMIKQHGAMFAKGRILGIQFAVLFENNLYFKGAKHGIDAAIKLSEVFKENNIRFQYPSQTNQIFVILNKKQQEMLSQYYLFEMWEHIDDNQDVVRFATSWCTDFSEIELLNNRLKGLA